MAGNRESLVAVSDAWVSDASPLGERLVTRLEAVARLGGEAWLNLSFADLSPDATLGTAFHLKLRDRAGIAQTVFTDADGEKTRKIEFVVAGVGPDRSYLRAVRTDHLIRPAVETSPGHFVLYQRGDRELLWDFLHRIAGAKRIAKELRETDVDIKALNDACPHGWCVAVPGRLPRPAGFAHALDAMAAAGGAVCGLVRTVAHAEGRIAGVYVDKDSIDAGRCLALSDKWRVAPVPPDSPRGRRTRIRRDEFLEPTEAAKQLFDPNKRHLAVGDDTLLPVAPVSVTVGEWSWFAVAVSTHIDLDAGNGSGDESAPNANIGVTLDLVEASSWVPSAGATGATILIGQVHCAADDDYAICIAPPLDDTKRELGPLADWVLGGEAKDAWLRVYEAAPGFVRPGQSAFCAQWRPADLVLFCVDAGGSAVILGALGRPLIEEGRKPCVSIMGNGISLFIGQADGNQKEMLTVSADNVVVAKLRS